MLHNLGVKRAMVVYGMDKMDEISLSAPSKVCEVRDGRFSTYEITPEQFGLKRCRKEELLGGSPAENAQIAREILSGRRGAKFDAVLINAGAAISIADGNLTVGEGIAKAETVMLNGAAMEQLDRLISLTNA